MLKGRALRNNTPAPPVTATVEVITDDGEIIDVPSPLVKAKPVALDEAVLDIKVLAAKKEIAKPLDLFGQDVDEAASKAQTLRKRISLQELKDAVIPDPA